MARTVESVGLDIAGAMSLVTLDPPVPMSAIFLAVTCLPMVAEGRWDPLRSGSALRGHSIDVKMKSKRNPRPRNREKRDAVRHALSGRSSACFPISCRKNVADVPA